MKQLIKVSLITKNIIINIRIFNDIACAKPWGGNPIPGMVERKLMDLEFVTCAAPRLLAQYGIPQTPTDIVKHYPTVAYFRMASTNTMPLMFKKGTESITIERNAYSSNNGIGVLNLTLNGLGIAQHAKIFVEPYVQSGELMEILPEWQRPTMPLNIVYPPNRHQSARLQVFIDWLIKTFRQGVVGAGG